MQEYGEEIFFPCKQVALLDVDAFLSNLKHIHHP
jgi:hypothetical protein